jgi:hypothetical protein
MFSIWSKKYVFSISRLILLSFFYLRNFISLCVNPTNTRTGKLKQASNAVTHKGTLAVALGIAEHTRVVTRIPGGLRLRDNPGKLWTEGQGRLARPEKLSQGGKSCLGGPKVVSGDQKLWTGHQKLWTDRSELQEVVSGEGCGRTTKSCGRIGTPKKTLCLQPCPQGSWPKQSIGCRLPTASQASKRCWARFDHIFSEKT